MPILCSGMVAASSALPATSPAGCIWQQYARQQIAATYHATSPVHAAGHTTVSKQPGYLLPLMPPWRYRLGTTTKKLPPAHLSPCMLPKPTAVHAAATSRQDLPAAHTTVHTAVALPPRRYRKKLPSCATAEELPSCATAEELPPCMPPGILPCSGSRAQRAGDSDVGANDKGACDDPGDWVDAH